MKEESRFVVCIKKGQWINFDGTVSEDNLNPKEGDICEIDETWPLLGKVYYGLKGYPYWYLSIKFRIVQIDFGEITASWAEEVLIKQSVLEEAC